jgi:hypothetical protein
MQKKMLLFTALVNLIFRTLFNEVKFQYHVYSSIILSFLILIAFLLKIKKGGFINLQIKKPFLWIFVFVFIILIFTSNYKFASYFQTLEFLSGIVNFSVIGTILSDDYEGLFFSILSFIGALVASVEANGKETNVDEVSPNENELLFTVPFAKTFRIIIKGIDTSGNEIVRVSSVLPSTSGD